MTRQTQISVQGGSHSSGGKFIALTMSDIAKYRPPSLCSAPDSGRSTVRAYVVQPSGEQPLRRRVGQPFVPGERGVLIN